MPYVLEELFSSNHRFAQKMGLLASTWLKLKDLKPNVLSQDLRYFLESTKNCKKFKMNEKP